ncbi:molybdopterin-dependent oxidoreductase [Nocardioides sp.]|uniref:molybdopterin-dependent oxidoreductase n=1 Tax=Nocardioides sp. TaxID=35761 RepID=UPI0035195BC7
MSGRVRALVPVRPPRPEDFTSPLRSPAVAARVGTWLGVAFAVCFVTGLISHWARTPDPWLAFPTRPAWGYRVTQGLHVVSGTAAVPLLLVKLWSVYHHLFAPPPSLRDPRRVLVTIAERGSIALLVASSIFQLVIGLQNSAQWYPWGFDFRSVHYAVSWVLIGALVIHLGVKWPLITAAWRHDVDDRRLDQHGEAPTDDDVPAPAGVLERRGLLRLTGVAAASAVVLTAGGTVPALRPFSLFAARSGDGPGGIPINTTARAARVVGNATAASWALTVRTSAGERAFSLAELRSLPQRTRTLPIACVEGWSASGEWRGVGLRELLDGLEVPRGREVRFRSLQLSGRGVTVLPADFVDDDATLLALDLDGEPLALDHGFPCRLIAPNRPGVYQTKWLSSLEVL